MNQQPQNDYPQSITLLRLYQKQSKAGQTYFSGTVGAVRYALIKTKFEDNGEAVWELKISPHKKESAPGQYQQPRPQQAAPQQPAQRRYEDFSSEFEG